MENTFPEKLRRLPYRIRKKTGTSGWLAPEGPREKSVDRTYPTVAPMMGSGGDAQTDYDEAKRGSLEDSPGGGTLSLHFPVRETALNTSEAFSHGFFDELSKAAAASPGVIERVADMLKDVKGRAVAGHQRRGIVGAASGVEEGLRKHPWLWLGPAGAYAGYRLLKHVIDWGKEQ